METHTSDPSWTTSSSTSWRFLASPACSWAKHHWKSVDRPRQSSIWWLRYLGFIWNASMLCSHWIIFLMESCENLKKCNVTFISELIFFFFCLVLVSQTFWIHLCLLSARMLNGTSLPSLPPPGTWWQVSVQLLSPPLLLETSSLHS